ncbi:hypothetical protein MMC19_003325 [Ptychographa xylographoides]|nr:hypothetical protein [Ptychographa xylographoides]
MQLLFNNRAVRENKIGADEHERGSGSSDHTLSNGNNDIKGGNSKGDGGESGDDGSQPPVGFWDKGLRKTRNGVFLQWGKTTIILSTAILAILSLYWAVLFNVEMNLNSLVVFVVDFETEANALVGPLITKTTEAQVVVNSMPHLGYITIPPSTYNNDPMAVRQAVYDQEAWAAIIINPNATALLRQAVEQGNSSFDPLGTCQIIYTSARDQDSYYDYILPELSMLQTQVTSMFGEMWVAQVMANTSIPRTNLAKAPQALNPAIGFSMFDLRPFYPYVAVPAVTIGLIYLIIIAFFSFTFFLPIHMQFIAPEKGHPVLKFYQLIIWRWLSTLVAYLIMSLAYSLISLAFQIPFSHDHASETIVAQNANPFGKATFMVYWMVNFTGMGALGLACENVAMVIGQPWTALWLIFWVITNVSTSFYALELSPGFYHWGYAWPLHSIVEASRTLIFDLHSRLGLDFGILLAWCAVNSALFPLCCYFMRWKTMREKKKSQ